jgi:DNA-binding NarL/FixJ family response regulator
MRGVIVVADRTIHAELLAEAIAHHDGIEVVGSGTEIALLASSGVESDVVVLDFASPQSNAAALAEARRRWPDAAVVVLDGLQNMDGLVAAIRMAENSLTMLSSATVARARDQLRSSVVRPRVGVYDRLTPREREVLELLSTGASPAAIAEQLRISSNTCRGYLRTLMAKLGARSQLEVVAFVGQHGLPDA